MLKKEEDERDPLIELARLIGGSDVRIRNKPRDAFGLLAEVILEKLAQKRLAEEKSKINHRIDWRW